MSRRPYGTGSLAVRTYTDGSEAWFGRYWIGPQQVNRKIGPKRAANSRTGLTKAQAEAQLRHLIASTSVTHSLGDRLTIAEAGATYIADARRKGRKASTLSNLDSEIRVHVEPFFADRSMQSITRQDIADLIAALERKGLAPKTIRNIIATVSAVYRFALHPDRRWAVVNPTESVSLPTPTTSTEIHYLTAAEIRKLLGHVPAGIYQASDRVMFAAAAWTGLRQGELRALRWQDVDLDAGRVRVRRSIVLGKIDTPKSARSVRSVPLTAELAEMLGTLRDGADGDALVFGHPLSGEPQPRANVSRRFSVALVAAGLPPRRFHDLRHSYGTAMAGAGVPMRTLQHFMGHRDHATTLRYSDYSPSGSEAAMAEAAFGGTSGKSGSPHRSQSATQSAVTEGA